MSAHISYGKKQIPVYRTYARPMTGLQPMPESQFMGRDNTLFAAEIDVEVFGDNFMPAYTQGDNSNVVATDTMKNFVLKKALEYDGSTLEGFLDFLGRQFLETYPHMQLLRLTGREYPFLAARVPNADGQRFDNSNVLFSHSRSDYALAVLDIGRDGNDTRVTAHQCGRAGLQLVKVTGSAFAQFPRDEYTTLPERVDR